MNFLVSAIVFFVITNTRAAPVVTDSNNSVIQSAGTVLTAAKDLGANLLVPPVKSREEVNLESEDLQSSIVSVYDNTHQKASNALNTPALIDTIKENEKYGNQGGSYDGIARMIVNGYESFSNFMNRILYAPDNLIRNLSKNINVHLDNIGGRIVGLN